MNDYHLHSTFSSDSVMTMDEACKKAISMGFDEIAFTDHIDLFWPGSSSFGAINLDEYFSSLDKMILKYGGKISIKKGIEVGIQPHAIKQTKNMTEARSFDFIIASVHCVDCIELDEPKYYSGKSAGEAYMRYFEEVLHTVGSYDHFSVLGHIDILRRYVPGSDNKTIKYSDYSDILDRILTTLINKNKGIELNTSGYKYGLGSFLPAIDFIKKYKELGGEIITVGSDAHRTEHIGHKFSEARELLQQCGFKYITRFDNMQPNFSKL